MISLLAAVPASHAQGPKQAETDKKLSAAKGDPPPGAARGMLPAIARIALRDLIKKRYLVSTSAILLTPSYTYMDAKNVEVDRNELRFDYDFVAGTKTPKPIHVSVLFQKWEYMKVLPADRSGSYYYLATTSGFWSAGLNGSIFAWKKQSEAQMAADAMNRLIYEARVAPPPTDDVASFAGQVRGWQENPASIPGKPASVDEFRILAEQALKDGDMVAVITNFESGVAAYPLWAEGWFNAALVYEQVGEYAAAANRMRHYLILAPNAPDAPAAKEKLVIWDNKAKRTL